MAMARLGNPPPLYSHSINRCSEADVVQNAERKFAVWHGVSQIVNLAMVILLIWRFWHLTHPNVQDGLSTFGQRKRNLFAK